MEIVHRSTTFNWQLEYINTSDIVTYPPNAGGPPRLRLPFLSLGRKILGSFPGLCLAYTIGSHWGILRPSEYVRPLSDYRFTFGFQTELPVGRGSRYESPPHALLVVRMSRSQLDPEFLLVERSA